MRRLRMAPTPVPAAAPGDPNVSVPAGFAGPFRARQSIFGAPRSGPVARKSGQVNQVQADQRPVVNLSGAAR